MPGEYFFARFYDPFVDPYIRKIRSKVLDLAREYRPENILDVCCGTGHQLKLLKKHGFVVTGVDLSEHMIKRSRSGENAVNCLKGDATALPFGEDSFSMVMITLALHENTVETATKILGEMFRVVKPEGCVILIDYEITPKTRSDARFITRSVEWMVGGEHYRNFKRYLENGGLKGLLKNFDFRVKTELRYAGKSLILLILQK
jgi:demethylmenaquinone methyltransferase/2-methoxy-6-polyprenyl-1,4-benzoquinol methylase